MRIAVRALRDLVEPEVPPGRADILAIVQTAAEMIESGASTAEREAAAQAAYLPNIYDRVARILIEELAR